MLNAVALVSDNVVHWTRWYDPWGNTRTFCGSVFAIVKRSTDVCLDGTQDNCGTCAEVQMYKYTQEWEQLTGIRCPWFDPIMDYRTDDDCIRDNHGDHEVRVRPKTKRVYCQCLATQDNNLYVIEGHTGKPGCCNNYCNGCGARGCFECSCGEYEHYDSDEHFADPGGVSALRAATYDRCPYHNCHKKVSVRANYCSACGGMLNPRKYACPNCRTPNALTSADKARGYQCDSCADRAERGWDY